MANRLAENLEWTPPKRLCPSREGGKTEISMVSADMSISMSASGRYHVISGVHGRRIMEDLAIFVIGGIVFLAPCYSF